MSPDIPLLIIGAAVAGFVQGASGFAFTMVAMSFWAWGLDPKLAAVMAVFGSWSGQIVGLAAARRRVSFVSLAPYLIGGLIGIPFGVMVLPYLNPNSFKLSLSIMLIVWCPLMLFAKDMPGIKAGGRLADGLAGAAGGFMGGIGGLSGVIPTLWCTLRGLEKEQQRAIIQTFNLATLSFTMVAYVATGLLTRGIVPLLPPVFFALLIPTLLGARLYTSLSHTAFRKMILVLLMLSGLSMLWASLPLRNA